MTGSGEGGARKEERARKEGREKGAEGAKERGGGVREIRFVLA